MSAITLKHWKATRSGASITISGTDTKTNQPVKYTGVASICVVKEVVLAFLNAEQDTVCLVADEGESDD